jgi:hypothetical protein
MKEIRRNLIRFQTLVGCCKKARANIHKNYLRKT